MATSPFASTAFLDPAKVGRMPITGQPPGQPPVPGANPTSAQVASTYQADLGRPMNPSEYQYWQNDPNYMADIWGSTEAQAFRANPPARSDSIAVPASSVPSPTPSAPGFAAFSTPQGMNDPRASAFFDTLMANVEKVPQVGADDPAIQAQTDAYAAQQTRAQRNILSADAEKAGPYGSIGAETRLAAETAGQNTGAFQAGLIGQERSARRNQIQSMLSMGGSFLTAEQQMALTKEMADMNLAEQSYEFGSNDAYRTSPFAAGATA